MRSRPCATSSASFNSKVRIKFIKQIFFFRLYFSGCYTSHGAGPDLALLRAPLWRNPDTFGRRTPRRRAVTVGLSGRRTRRVVVRHLSGSIWRRSARSDGLPSALHTHMALPTASQIAGIPRHTAIPSQNMKHFSSVSRAV